MAMGVALVSLSPTPNLTPLFCLLTLSLPWRLHGVIERTWALELDIHRLEFFPTVYLLSLHLLYGDNIDIGLSCIMNVKHLAHSRLLAKDN